MTTREAAELLGVEVGTVSRLIHRKKLKGEKFGPVWMVEKDSVRAYQASIKGKSKFDPTRGKADN